MNCRRAFQSLVDHTHSEGANVLRRHINSLIRLADTEYELAGEKDSSRIGTANEIGVGIVRGTLGRQQRSVPSKFTRGISLLAAILVSGTWAAEVVSTTLAATPPLDNRGHAATSAQRIDPQPLKTLIGHENWVFDVAVSSDGRTAITSSADKTVRIWDTEKGLQKALLRSPGDGWVYSVALAPDGKEFIAGETGRVAAYDLATAKETWNYRSPNKRTHFKSINFDRTNYFACAGSDGVVSIWDATQKDLPPREIVPRRKTAGAKLHACCLSPDGGRVALSTGTVSAASSEIEVWDVARGECLRTIIPQFGGVDHLEFAADGKRMLSCGHSITWGFTNKGSIASPNNEDSVILWDTYTGRVIRKFGLKPKPATENPPPSPPTQKGEIVVPAPVSHVRITNDAKFSPDGRFLVTAERNTFILIYRVETGEQVAEVRGHYGEVRSIALSADGSRLVSVSHDVTGLVWDLKELLDRK